MRDSRTTGVSSGDGRETDPASPDASWTTSWTVILSFQSRGPEYEDAAKRLFERYRVPILAHFRRCGATDYEEWYDEFMAEVFFPKIVDAAAEAKGRFRGLLGIALRRFIASKWRDHGRDPLSRQAPVEALDEGSGAAADLAAQDRFQEAFDRDVARTAFEYAMAAVKAHYEATRKSAEFTYFSARQASSAVPGFETIATEWGTTEGNVKQKAMDFRRLVRQELCREAGRLTLEGEAEAEARYFLKLLAGPAPEPKPGRRDSPTNLV